MSIMSRHDKRATLHAVPQSVPYLPCKQGMIPPPDPLEAIITLVELGQEIRKRYKTYAHAEADLSELDTRLRYSLWVLEVFRKVIERSMKTLLHRQQQDIALLIDHLQGIFDRLDKQLSRFPRDDKLDFVGKLRWTFKGKSGYEAILHEIAEWRSEVGDVITAIKLLQEEKEEDRNIYKKLFDEECGGIGINSADRMDDVLHGRLTDPEDIFNVDATVVSSVEGGGNTKDGDRVIIQGRNIFMKCRYPNARSSQELEEYISDVTKLACVLRQVDASSMHILRCKGMIYQAEFDRTVLFYEIPSEPTRQDNWTLAQAIEDKRTLKPSLNVRIRYAVEICTAVMFTHAAGLVHKSISAENILILRSSTASNTGTKLSSYLVGFDAARLRDPSAYSAQRAETDPLKRLYQHPERQIALHDGDIPRFGIRHDMYSLGVILLELAMWTRVQYITDSDLEKYREARGQDFDARQLQALLAELVRQSFAGLTGTIYADAVLCCLQDTVLNQRSEREMRELFYERVLQPLKQIVV